jgi:hypothetical protein
MIVKGGAKRCMPCTRGLLEAIESLDHVPQMVRLSRVLNTWRLAHINLHFKNTMEKCILTSS